MLIGPATDTPAVGFAGLLVAYVCYLRHAWHLWKLDPSCYPHFVRLATRLASISTPPDETPRAPSGQTVALDVAAAPILTTVAVFAYLWLSWKCGAVDRYTEEVATEPYLQSVLTMVMAAYYWWAVRQRSRRHRDALADLLDERKLLFLNARNG